MPIPIMCLDEALANYAAAFRGLLSKPQYQYFVTVLMALALCQQAKTLSGLVCTTAHAVSVSGLSRFLSEAPWSAEHVARVWLARFAERMLPLVNKEHERQRLEVSSGPKKRGRPKATVVTGYLIGDDSTVSKRKGKKMEGLGVHYSTTERKPITGHSLVQGLYVLLGCRCPLQPDLYWQQLVCDAEGRSFRSKIDIMVECIRSFEPVPGTLTYVLLDSWYCAKAIWKAVRERGFQIVCGLKAPVGLEHPVLTLKSNRVIKTPGGEWQTLSQYTATLKPEDYKLMDWPGQSGRKVNVYVLKTRVRKLYRCQVMIAREKLDGPLSEVRYFATSDMDADLQAFLNHVAARWDIEVLFGDAKELLRLDQYQLMTSTAILRFWTLIMATYAYLDEVRVQLAQERGRHTTLGDARREVQKRHYQHAIDTIAFQTKQGVTQQQLYATMAV